MKNFYLPFIITCMLVSTTSYASDWAHIGEILSHNKTKKEKKELEQKLQEKERRIEHLEKEQIRVYKRDHCRNNRACRQTPPQVQEVANQ